MKVSANANHATGRRIMLSRALVRVGFWLVPAMGLLIVFARSVPPDNLGVRNGRLASCPQTPNCVSTQAQRRQQRIAPLTLRGDVATVKQAVLAVIGDMVRTRIVRETDDYVHVECTSAICRFIDDFEVWIDAAEGTIHARSASRVGYSDLGANRKRVEQFFAGLIEKGVAVANPTS